MSSLREIKTVQPKKPANLFMAEMIMAMLFFSISGAVILSVFAAADGKMRRCVQNDSILLCAQSCAEAYSLSGDAGEMAEIVFGGGAEVGEEALQISLNAQCMPSESGEIMLTVTETENVTDAGTLRTAELLFTHDGETLQRLECSAYIPTGEVGGNA